MPFMESLKFELFDICGIDFIGSFATSINLYILVD